HARTNFLFGFRISDFEFPNGFGQLSARREIVRAAGPLAVPFQLKDSRQPAERVLQWTVRAKLIQVFAVGSGRLVANSIAPVQVGQDRQVKGAHAIEKASLLSQVLSLAP